MATPDTADDARGESDEIAARLSSGDRLHVHVVGIGGAGMSAIASVLSAMGHVVSGSDLKDSSNASRLTKAGVTVHRGHDASNVVGADLVTYSPAVPEGNVELREARSLGLALWPRSKVLAALSKIRKTVAVAGTHGKTTTASMLSLILVEAGLKPSFLIGAEVNEIGSNGVWDEGEWLVMEADESYGTFRSLRPEIVVLTNVEPDHLDYYESFENLIEAFEGLLGSSVRTPLVCGDDRYARTLGARSGAIAVGGDENDAYRMKDVVLGRSSAEFDIVGPGLPSGTDGPSGRDATYGRVTLPVPGMHNALNAAMAAAAALELGVSFGDVGRALARFAGVPRRFEFRGVANGVTFVDDYAHLPSEVRATLATARSGGWERVVAVFQPHRFTRTASLSESFADAFDDADVVVVTDVFSAGEPPIPGVSGNLVAEAISRSRTSRNVRFAGSRSELKAFLEQTLRPGDLCCTMGAGDLTTLPDEFLGAVRR
ncbi:MAG: UDP-N-acetylmuramate--L-alanine ligase [Acidimicrobiales bacterium]